MSKHKQSQQRPSKRPLAEHAQGNHPNPWEGGLADPSVGGPADPNDPHYDEAGPEGEGWDEDRPKSEQIEEPSGSKDKTEERLRGDDGEPVPSRSKRNAQIPGANMRPLAGSNQQGQQNDQPTKEYVILQTITHEGRAYHPGSPAIRLTDEQAAPLKKHQAIKAL